MSVSDAVSSHGGYQFLNRRLHSPRPELHKPKHIANTNIKYGKLILEKNFTSAELALRQPMSEVTFTDLKRTSPSEMSAQIRMHNDDSSLPLVRSSVHDKNFKPVVRSAIQFKSKTTLDHVDFTSKSLDYINKENGNTPNIELKGDLSRLSYSKQGQIQVKRHITSARLCEHLKARGLGDPRDNLPKRENADPRYLLFKRKRQKERYSYYEEKLRGRARLDMYTANLKAAAFIEQQKDAQPRASSAYWHHRFRRVVGNDGVEHDYERVSDSQSDKNAFTHFVAWNEDRPRITVDEKFLLRINSWITQVHEAMTAKEA